MIDFAQIAALDERTGKLGVFVEPQILGDHQRALHLPGSVDEFGRLLPIQGHRLFQQDMLAGLEGLERHRRVQMRRQRDDDGIDVGLFEQLAKVGVTARDVMAGGGFAGELRIGFGQRHRRRAMAGDKAVEVVEAYAARSDDRTA